MARYRRKKPLWATMPLWAMAMAVMGWGIWQAQEFRRTLQADVQLAEVRAARGAIPMDNAGATGTRPAVSGGRDGPGVGFGDGGENLTPVGLAQAAPPEATIEFVDPLLSVSPQEAAEQAAPAVDPALTANELVVQARKLMDGGRIVEGRAALNAALDRTSDEQQAGRLREVLSGINGSIFLGSAILPEDPLARYIDIQPGDSFLRLGKKYSLTAAYLEQINPSLNPRNLKPLIGVKVVPGPFSVRLVKHASRLDLYARDMFVRSMAIQLPEGNYLPPGDYRVAAGTKIQVGSRCWVGYEGTQQATETVGSGWLFGPGGPRGNAARDRISGVQLGDSDMLQLYNVLVESKSHLRVIP